MGEPLAQLAQAIAGRLFVELEASGRHVHVTAAQAQTLFGHSLTPERPLSQPGQYLAKERVTVTGPKGSFRNVAVLGWTGSAEREADFLRSIGCAVRYYDRPRGVEILGDETVTGVRVNGREEAADAVFLLRPAVAPAALLPGLAMENGSVTVDRQMATNLPGVFAAGDCTGAPYQVAKAVGEGLIAGQSAAKWADRQG